MAGSPTPTGPTGAITASAGYDTPTFSWSSVSGANHYYLYVLDNTTNQPVVNNSNVSGTTFAATTGLTPGHSFTWYIAAASTDGALAWSGPTAFSLVALAAPTQGPGGTISVSAGFDTPTFSWSSVTGANRYYLYVLDTTTNQPAVNNPNVTVTSFAANTGLTPGHSYTWYIGAESTNGNGITWTGPKSFSLAGLPAPAALNLIGFASASSVTTKPTFSWTPVTGANHYTLYLLDATTNQVIADSIVTGTTFKPGTALTVGHHYVWYIAADSTNGSSFWSGPDMFTLLA